MISRLITICALTAVSLFLCWTFVLRDIPPELAQHVLSEPQVEPAEVMVIKGPQYAAELELDSESTAEEFSEDDSDSFPEESLKLVQSSLETVDLEDKESFLRALRSIRETPESATILVSKFKKTIPGQELRRDKILFLAGKIEDPELLPLWQDILYRETPRFENEELIQLQSHPTLESRLIAVEQMQAIRKLGQLAFDNHVAKGILFDTALGLSPNPVSLVHREHALKILGESDPNAYLKVMTRIDKTDQLYTRLSSRTP
ncbi:hypothetical protein [Pseudobacteriovorax antillogorgiicola]|uniref:Uncharacterized protein n=1 Tax=Pseudobacteriovorax antillogorgiicola TaxID=1513793 RepID=A0A1Y6C814_9BACT|nr:hypothetical protein [Pseudobacteriovorax antillogorgiicola]TCS51774.1 hypothetical protein EDD56_110159 [Pseudobacteriovorax antillogorgiicola]SMF49887.1 hypothetical protein SAMN06296036_115128 [Pseudobacteriovorax antillogorgiicola]